MAPPHLCGGAFSFRRLSNYAAAKPPHRALSFAQRKPLSGFSARFAAYWQLSDKKLYFVTILS